MSTLPGVITSGEPLNLIAIQGEPNSGKTYAALTFPNPLVLDFDKKLPAGIQSVPFWNTAYVHQLMNTKPPVFCNQRDAIRKWLKNYGPSIPADTTLVLDSWTNLQKCFDIFAENNQEHYYSKENKYDRWAVYRHKIFYSFEILNLLKGLACTCIVTLHETWLTDRQGNESGKFKPLMDGQFRDELMGHMGCAFRMDHYKERWRLQVKTDKHFSAIVSSRFKFPADVTHLDVTDGAWPVLEKYQTQKNQN